MALRIPWRYWQPMRWRQDRDEACRTVSSREPRTVKHKYTDLKPRAMKRLRLGDRITFALTRTTRTGVVERLDVDGGFGFYATYSSGAPLLLEDEGVTWLLGHHEKDSLEALALLAARTLSRP